jgi:hypothetical protein
MKNLLALVLAVGVASGATFVVVSNKKSAAFAGERERLQAEWDAEKEKLERELRRLRGQTPRVETLTTTVEVPVDGRITPDQIIQRLARVQPATDNTERANQLREVIHLLESLREHGHASVPAIRGFLALNQDIDYDPAGGGGGPGGPGGFGGGDGERSRGGPPGGFRGTFGGDRGSGGREGFGRGDRGGRPPGGTGNQ